MTSTIDTAREEALAYYGLSLEDWATKRTPWSGRYARRLTRLTLAVYGDRCHLCGGAGADSADHLMPRSLGGDDSLDNLRPAHVKCNSARGNRPLPSTQPYNATEYFT